MAAACALDSEFSDSDHDDNTAEPPKAFVLELPPEDVTVLGLGVYNAECYVSEVCIPYFMTILWFYVVIYLCVCCTLRFLILLFLFVFKAYSRTFLSRATNSSFALPLLPPFRGSHHIFLVIFEKIEITGFGLWKKLAGAEYLSFLNSPPSPECANWISLRKTKKTQRNSHKQKERPKKVKLKSVMRNKSHCDVSRIIDRLRRSHFVYVIQSRLDVFYGFYPPCGLFLSFLFLYPLGLCSALRLRSKGADTMFTFYRFEWFFKVSFVR